MPITRLQTELLELLAARRDAESFVAGGVPINQDGPRFSSDIDIFHDREERVAAAAEADAKIAIDAGYKLEWMRRQPAMYSARIISEADETRLEWTVDADYRFFPALRDKTFGFVLHIADLAVNKMAAAAGRREARDVVDLLTIDEKYLPLGAVAWAAVDVSPGFTPEGLLEEVRRNARHPASAYRELKSAIPIDPDEVVHKLSAALERAHAFVAKMPSEAAGLLFLNGERPVQPDPGALDKYVRHRAQRQGHWPSSSEIGHAMLERYTSEKT